MYIYNGGEINEPIYIHFLCGKKYDNLEKIHKDKRNVIENFIRENKNLGHPIILEKYYNLNSYLSLGLENLEQVELLISYYASSIIILHETVSTAAEIALFGSKKNLKNKILVINPRKEDIEVDNLSGFLTYAYFYGENTIEQHSYKFEKELYTKLKNVRFFNTHFEEEILNDEFINIIKSFFNKSLPKTIDLSFIKSNVKQENNSYYIIDYSKKKIAIRLKYELIIYIIISIILNDEYNKKIEYNDNTISNICDLIKRIFVNTILYAENINESDYLFNLKMIDNSEINVPVRFCENVLRKLNVINVGNKYYSTNIFSPKQKSEIKDLIKKAEKKKSFFDDID